jgi:hypothetical protein
MCTRLAGCLTLVRCRCESGGRRVGLGAGGENDAGGQRVGVSGKQRDGRTMRVGAGRDDAERRDVDKSEMLDLNQTVEKNSNRLRWNKSLH